ncbi:MAG: MFS transporter [Nannocystaceae bacterium]
MTAPSRAPEAGSKPRDTPRTSAHVWVSSTYFSEGLPYYVVNNLADVMFKQAGASLQAVGLTTLFHLPWNLKFLWGPFLDQYATKRRWLVGSEVLLSIILVALAWIAQTPGTLVLVSVAFLALAFASATHDVAIDGYYLEALDHEGQSKFVGYRASAYRVSAVLVSGPLLVAIGEWGWSAGLMGAAVFMMGLTWLHSAILPRVEVQKRSLRELLRAALGRRVVMAGAALAALIVVERRYGWISVGWHGFLGRTPSTWGLAEIGMSGWIALAIGIGMTSLLAFRRRLAARLGRGSTYAEAYVTFFSQPQVGRMLAFVILFRVGESLLLKMRWPFLQDELGMSLEGYGWINGTAGVIASFVATFLGGWLIARHGLRRWIWPFMLAQNTLNLLYCGLAADSLFGVAPDWAVGSVIVAEHFGAGLGTAVFMVYIMRCCHPDHKAGHMAIVTALMSVGYQVAGTVSGFLAEAIGFMAYFGFSFVAAAPAMLLAFWIPHLDETGPRAPSAVT